MEAPLVNHTDGFYGKTNLSEWANMRSSHASSGWSARGGQTRNPYALNRTPSGSSSGSAVAVAANLCAVAVDAHAAREMPLFDQELLRQAQAKGSLDGAAWHRGSSTPPTDERRRAFCPASKGAGSVTAGAVATGESEFRYSCRYASGF